jgi:hypothetical protein
MGATNPHTFTAITTNEFTTCDLGTATAFLRAGDDQLCCDAELSFAACDC